MPTASMFRAFICFVVARHPLGASSTKGVILAGSTPPVKSPKAPNDQTTRE